MKVLLVFDNLNAGGAETSLVAMVNANEDPCVEFYIAVLYGSGPLRPKVQLDADHFIVHDIGGKYNFVKGAKYLRGLIRRIGPTLVHATLFRSEIVCRLALLDDRSTYLVGSFVNDSYSRLHYALKGSWLGKLKLAAVQAIDAATQFRVNTFLAITETTKTANARALLVSKDRIKVIYRGRNVRQFTTVARAHHEAASTTLLTTGRLIWRKGYRESLTAVSRAAGEAISYRVAGDGVNAQAIEEFADRLPNRGRVTFLGHVTEIANELAGADFLLMPSHYEGLGGSLIEAMLARVPIIASDIPVHREVTDGNALFFKVKDSDSLLRAIDELPPRAALQEMIEAAYALAVSRYDIEHITAQTIAFYRAVTV